MENEKRLDLIDRQALGIGRCNPDAFPVQHRGYCAGWNGAIALIEQAPTVDAVSRGVHDQVRWERDVAIEQLESYGISLGEKADVVKVVRCKDCKNGRQPWLEGQTMVKCMVGKGAIVTPEHFCSYGERKDNERKAD